MPIGRVACQARHLQPEHDADTSKTDFGDQALESFSVPRTSGGLPKITVDHDSPIERPAQGESSLTECILPVSALGVLEDLTQCRLADVQIRQARQMRGRDLLMSFTVHCHQRYPSL